MTETPDNWKVWVCTVCLGHGEVWSWQWFVWQKCPRCQGNCLDTAAKTKEPTR